MRDTQIQAYNEIASNGLLSLRRFQVYEIVVECDSEDGVTGGEVDRILSRRVHGWSRGGSPRLNELVKLGVIEELPEPRQCKETGMRVLAYRANGKLPSGKVRTAFSWRKELRCAMALLREPLVDDAQWNADRVAFLERNGRTDP